jgi:hypothetical protein
MISRDNVKLKMVSSLAMQSQHAMKYIDEELGISCEIITNKLLDGSFGKGQTFFFINHDDREFTDIDSLIEAYNEKFKFEGESPNHKVKYVRVITKIN